MYPNYGGTSGARNLAVSVFVPFVSFLVKSPYVAFSISTLLSPVMLHFKILVFLNL